MLEAIRRDPAQATAEQKEIVARAAEWIVSKQARLPDGTLWRPTAREGPTSRRGS